MCGRYSITLPPEAILHLFQTHGELPNWPAYCNAHRPLRCLSCARRRIAAIVSSLMQWALTPWFSKDGKPPFSTINARASRSRRIAASCRRRDTSNGPARRTTDSRTTSPAPMVTQWRSPVCGPLARKDKSETKETFTIVTTAPSAFAAQFHDRMPCVLEMEDVQGWLPASPDHAAALMKPANEDVPVSRPVNKAVGNVKNNTPDLPE